MVKTILSSFNHSNLHELFKFKIGIKLNYNFYFAVILLILKKNQWWKK